MKKQLFAAAIGLAALAALALPVAAQDSLDFSEEAEFGTISLVGGFLPDPYIATVNAGGAVDVSTLDLGAGCLGFTTVEPTLELSWENDEETNLRVFATSTADIALAINTAGGEWICNDDGAEEGSGLNPSVVLEGAASGTYDIYVTVLDATVADSGLRAPVYLFVTEFETNTPAQFSSAMFPEVVLGE